MANLIGQRIGNYKITGVLGKGGMAVVYRARQLNIQREVAIKVIKPDITESYDIIKRFEQEVNTIASLTHPHILKLFDAGQYEGMLYLVMELLTGGALSNLIRGNPLPLERAERLLDQMADALDYAHSQGLIHRDLKPQNILLDKQGNAHLADFGIAKILGATTTLTQSGTSMGTPSYMSPEQWQGSPLTHQVDLYAFGVVLFEMLAGRLPFIADTPAHMMYCHLQEPPPPIRTIRAELPASLDDVFSRALAKPPEDRFGSADELRSAFRAAIRGPSAPTHAKAPVTRQQTPQPAITEQATIRDAETPGVPVSTRLNHSRRGAIIGALAVLLIVAAFLVIRGASVPTGVVGAATATNGSTNVAAVATATGTPATAPTTVPATVIPSVSPTPTDTPTAAPTATPSATPSLTPSATFTPTFVSTTAVPTTTGTPTRVPPTATPSVSPSAILSMTPSVTYSPTFDPIAAAKATNTAEALRLAALNAGLTATAALWTPTSTATSTPTPDGSTPVTKNSQWKPQFKDFDGVAMALVPAGCFMMGDYQDGGKQCFDKPFWIDKTEVTQAEFRKFDGVAQYFPYFKGDQRPVDSISWFEARAFCAKRGAWLPTEAEWEYAGRGPDDLMYPWGNSAGYGHAVAVSPSQWGVKVQGQTENVGSRLADTSWVGAIDMAGNAWEWVSSINKPYPYNKDDGRESSKDTSSIRVIRGAASVSALNDGRLTWRGAGYPNSSFVPLGFRCARS
jgi:serine/threonine protein kinase/formylglycine-generating enzyme required for sulfatase activity